MDTNNSQEQEGASDSSLQPPKPRRTLFGYLFEPVNDVKIVNVPSDLRSLDNEAYE